MARENRPWNRLCMQGWNCRKIACRVLLGENVSIPRYMLFLCCLIIFRITQLERREKETGMASSEAFYNVFLEIPACSPDGYYLLCEISTSTSTTTTTTTITLKHFPYSFCRTIDAHNESNFVSRMYVTVFLPLISAARSLTSPQESFVQSK